MTRFSSCVAALVLSFGAAAQEIPSSYDPEAMAQARAALKAGHGGQIITFLQAERLEWLNNAGQGLFVWDVQGWAGTDRHKLWLKTEGERLLAEGRFEETEVQALYSRAISSFFDLQAGVRHDTAPDAGRTFAVAGLQGLAPYRFEVDTALFLSDEGDLLWRTELEYEFLFTQRLILQPRAELDFAAQDDAVRGIGRGLADVELGARLRYEIRREVAPYVGVEWGRAVGRSADFARATGDDVGTVSLAAGLRLWF